jgi:hypothetical protein
MGEYGYQRQMLCDIGKISGMEGVAIVHIDLVRLEVARGSCIIGVVRRGA